jgi:HSP20 family protein
MSMMTLLPRRWRTDENEGFTSLQRAMNELFADFVPTLDLPAVAGPAQHPKWLPRLDFIENEKEFLVTAELPGVDQKNVDVTLVGDMLTLKGEKKVESEERGRTWIRSERTWGSFQRVLELPCEVDHKSIKAVFQSGLLKVTLPKAIEALRPVSKIEVKAT